MAHITGGGLPGNLPRVLPEGLGARVDERRWQAPAVFDWLAGLGVERDEMRRVFNGGLGYVAVVPAGRGAAALAACEARRLRGVAGRRDRARRGRRVPGGASEVRLGVLVSGSGSNLQALIERVHGRSATIAGVCSSNDEAYALERARAAGIESAVFALAAHARRARRARDRAMADWLAERGVGLVVCAGFMGVLTAPTSSRASPRACSTCTPRCCRRFPGAHAIEDALRRRRAPRPA